MLKSLIIAATSIACIFLSGNISQARKPVSHSLERNTDGCLSHKFTQKEISLVPAEDIRGICRMILEYYKRKNENTLKFEATRRGFVATEIVEMKLINYEKNKINSIKVASVEVTFIKRIVNLNKDLNQLTVSSENRFSSQLDLINSSGKWVPDQTDNVSQKWD
jgi:hypothetical protein